jgi:death on curing protein
MDFLTKEDILYINAQTILHHGGNYSPPSNFLHEENLDYLLDAASAEMFGSPLYPTISDKAAVYCYNIICNHIFLDGNKRTGLEAALAFLKLNGHRLNPKLPNGKLLNFIIQVASGEITLEECRVWFKENTVVIL